eukprot:TRINITY_DN4996_c0_g1_i1.p1 TRINITY_DN4996_c0_g1~~TRINITY_DN4996_c0_g1_i1.p1  ORF type:complete len:1079 (-),score=106.04 TRINITY_DN4996_c0_g1_i1:1472-4267(-)
MIVAVLQASSASLLMVPCRWAFNDMWVASAALAAEWSAVWRLFPVIFSGLCAWMNSLAIPVFSMLHTQRDHQGHEYWDYIVIGHIAQYLCALPWFWFIFQAVHTILLRKCCPNFFAAWLIRAVVIVELFAPTLSLVLSPYNLDSFVRTTGERLVDVLYVGISLPVGQMFFLLCVIHISHTPQGQTSNMIGLLSAQIYNNLLLLPFRFMGTHNFVWFAWLGTLLFALKWGSIAIWTGYGLLLAIVQVAAGLVCLLVLITAKQRSFEKNTGSLVLVISAAVTVIVQISSVIPWDNLAKTKSLLVSFVFLSHYAAPSLFILCQSILLTFRNVIGRAEMLMWIYLFNVICFAVAFADLGLKLIARDSNSNAVVELLVFWAVAFYHCTVLALLPLPSQGTMSTVPQAADGQNDFVSVANWQHVEPRGLLTYRPMCISPALLLLVIATLSTLAVVDPVLHIIVGATGTSEDDALRVLSFVRWLCTLLLLTGPTRVLLNDASTTGLGRGSFSQVSQVAVDNLWHHYPQLITVVLAWLSAIASALWRLDELLNVVLGTEVSSTDLWVNLPALHVPFLAVKVLERLAWAYFFYRCVPLMLLLAPVPQRLAPVRRFLQAVALYGIGAWCVDRACSGTFNELMRSAVRSVFGELVFCLVAPIEPVFLCICVAKVLVSPRQPEPRAQHACPGTLTLLMPVPQLSLRSFLYLLFTGGLMVSLNVYDEGLYGIPKTLLAAVLTFSGLHCLYLVLVHRNRLFSPTLETLVLWLCCPVCVGSLAVDIWWQFTRPGDFTVDSISSPVWAQIAYNAGMLLFLFAQTVLFSLRRPVPLSQLLPQGKSLAEMFYGVEEDALSDDSDIMAAHSPDWMAVLGMPWMYTLNFACFFFVLSEIARTFLVTAQLAQVTWYARWTLASQWVRLVAHGLVLALLVDAAGETRRRKEPH